jgi:hypothetical protein
MLPALTVQGSSAKLVKKWLRSVGNMPQPRVGRNGGFRCQLIGSSRWRRLTKVRLCVFILRDDRFLVMQNDIRLTDCAILEL